MDFQGAEIFHVNFSERISTLLFFITIFLDQMLTTRLDKLQQTYVISLEQECAIAVAVPQNQIYAHTWQHQAANGWPETALKMFIQQ